MPLDVQDQNPLGTKSQAMLQGRMISSYLFPRKFPRALIFTIIMFALLLGKAEPHDTGFSHFHITSFWCEDDCCSTDKNCQSSDLINRNGTQGWECITHLSNTCKIWAHERWNIASVDLGIVAPWAIYLRMPWLYGTQSGPPAQMMTASNYADILDSIFLNMTAADYSDTAQFGTGCDVLWRSNLGDPDKSWSIETNLNATVFNVRSKVVPVPDSLAPPDSPEGQMYPYQNIYPHMEIQPIIPQETGPQRFVGNNSALTFGGAEWAVCGWGEKSPVWEVPPSRPGWLPERYCWHSGDCWFNELNTTGTVLTLDVWRQWRGLKEITYPDPPAPLVEQPWPDWMDTWNRENRPSLVQTWRRRLEALSDEIIAKPSPASFSPFASSSDVHRYQLRPSLRGAESYKTARRILMLRNPGYFS